jgi:hypothetical protein
LHTNGLQRSIKFILCGNMSTRWLQIVVDMCMCMRRYHCHGAGKSLFFARRCTHSSLVCVHAALSGLWHGKQAVSLCSSRSAALTAHSCVLSLYFIRQQGVCTVLYFVSCC